MTLNIACILVLVLLAAWLLVRKMGARVCPECKCRHLREVTSIDSKGATAETRGAFTFYRCEFCGESLQRQDNGPITKAGNWRKFIGENDFSNPSRPNT
jgi:transposase-like protein